MKRKEKIKKLTCNDCRKCGENICGNDIENLKCFEPKIIEEKITKELLIGRLIDDDIDTIYSETNSTYLADMLRGGFIGYNKYTLKELKQEAKERELI